MESQQNIADMMTSTLHAIERIDEGMDENHPERHAIRNLKLAAEQSVIEGLKGALAIADAARNVRQAVAEVKTEAVAQAPQDHA